MAIVRKEAFFSSCNNVNKIRTLIWEDKDIKPKGIIQIAHGISEHIGRYDEFARFLVKNGFVVCGNDHLGHGKSIEAPADLGYVFDGDHVNMVRDMNTLQNIMTKRYPGIPYFIFGHSMGSFLARIYSAAFGESLAGAVYCGTGQLPLPLVMMEDYVDPIIDSLPENSKAANSLNLIMGKVTKRILKDDDDLAWLSKSKTNIEKYKEDPLCNFMLTTSLAKELIMLSIKASEPDWPSKLPKDFPILLISGARDPVGMFGRGVLQVSENLSKVGLEPKMILYPGDRHEILNEDDRDKVYRDVLDFFEDIVNGK